MTLYDFPFVPYRPGDGPASPGRNYSCCRLRFEPAGRIFRTGNTGLPNSGCRQSCHPCGKRGYFFRFLHGQHCHTELCLRTRHPDRAEGNHGNMAEHRFRFPYRCYRSRISRGLLFPHPVRCRILPVYLHRAGNLSLPLRDSPLHARDNYRNSLNSISPTRYEKRKVQSQGGCGRPVPAPVACRRPAMPGSGISPPAGRLPVSQG